MHARFRIRRPDGRELTPDSLEAFARLVKSGDVGEPDLIYDALTGEWAPARAHPVFRMVADSVLAVSANAGSDPGESEQETAEADLGSALGLSLAPPVPEPTLEQERAAFVEEMAVERRAEAAARPVLSACDLGIEPRRESATERSSPEAPKGFPRRLPDGDPVLRSGPLFWAVTAFVLVVVGVALPIRARDSDRAQTPRPALVQRVSRPVSVDERAFRARAETLFMEDATQFAREVGVGEIPADFLSGPYLANASSYPEAGEAWERYLALAWAWRARETRVYREAYLATLDSSGVTGSARSLRLADALLDFGALRAEREPHYARVEELATAAISLHVLLNHLEGSLRYEPASANPMSADPVLGVSAGDDESRVLLERALDRFVAALEAEGGGPAELALVPEWALRGLEEAVMR